MGIRQHWLGGLLLGPGILAIMYVIGQGAQWGWADPRVPGLIVGGLVLLAVFVRVERVGALVFLLRAGLHRFVIVFPASAFLTATVVLLACYLG